MYGIHVNASSNLIEIEFKGLLAPDEAAAYIAAVRHAMVTRGLKAGYRMLIVISDCPIQPQDTIKVLAEHIEAMPKASRIAVVTGSSLAKMQMRRLFKQPYARIVSDEVDGRAWVLSGVEPIVKKAVG